MIIYKWLNFHIALKTNTIVQNKNIYVYL